MDGLAVRGVRGVGSANGSVSSGSNRLTAVLSRESTGFWRPTLITEPGPLGVCTIGEPLEEPGLMYAGAVRGRMKSSGVAVKNAALSSCSRRRRRRKMIHATTATARRIIAPPIAPPTIAPTFLPSSFSALLTTPLVGTGTRVDKTCVVSSVVDEVNTRSSDVNTRLEVVTARVFVVNGMSVKEGSAGAPLSRAPAFVGNAVIWGPAAPLLISVEERLLVKSSEASEVLVGTAVALESFSSPGREGAAVGAGVAESDGALPVGTAEGELLFGEPLGPPASAGREGVGGLPCPGLPGAAVTSGGADVRLPSPFPGGPSPEGVGGAVVVGAS